MPLSGIHWRSSVVSFADSPAALAPGFSRPMIRSQLVAVWLSRELAPCIVGSWLSAIQDSGGSLRSVSPKNPGGAMPTTVKGWPSTISVDPRIEGSAP
jgi:hypothetical protein